MNIEEVTKKERRKSAALLVKERNWKEDPSLIDLYILAEEVGLSCEDIDLYNSKYFDFMLTLPNGDIVLEGEELKGYLHHEELSLDGRLTEIRNRHPYDIDFTFDELLVNIGRDGSVVSVVDDVISDAIERQIDEEDDYWEQIDQTRAML